MEHLNRFLKYLKYFLTAKSANSIHSPFVFELYTNLVLNETPFYIFDKIEDLRLVLENDNRKIFVTDFGASYKNAGNQKSEIRIQKKIKSIARKSAAPAKYGQLLFRMVNKFRPGIILEIGTSLGLATLYLASPNSKTKVITMEGCPEISKIAKMNFEKLKVKNIEQVVGNFDETLPILLDKISPSPVGGQTSSGGLSQLLYSRVRPLDFVFFDGNHRKEPTLRYFELCLKKSHSETIFIFDDIHWSNEMESAWNEIKKNPEVKVSIDLFFFGIVFFRKELTKQDFVLRF